MKEIYNNELFSQSKPEIKKVWDNCWERLSTMDPSREYDEFVELNNMFDKCVEAYTAVDCGDRWEVKSASKVRGKFQTYIVMKES